MGLNTVSECKSLHLESIPVEPRNQIQMDTILSMAGMLYNT